MSHPAWCFVSGADDAFRPIFDLTTPTHQTYATSWGAQWSRATWPVNPNDPPSWRKLRIMREALDFEPAPTEWVCWVDADAGFTPEGMGHWIGDNIERRQSVHVAFQDYPGGRWPCLGLMIVRNDRIGRSWLDQLEALKPKYLHHPWWEQAAAYELLGYDNQHILPDTDSDPRREVTRWSSLVGFIPAPWHRTPQIPHDGPTWLFHATGYRDAAARIAMLKDALA